MSVRLVLLACLALALAPGTPAAAEVESPSLLLSSDLGIRVRHGRSIELWIQPAVGDGFLAIARRVTDDPADAEAIAAFNGDRGPVEGEWVRVPLAMLSDQYRALVLFTMFPDDRRDGEDWIHVARSGVIPTYDEGMWQVAEWFTGNGSGFDELMRANRLSSPELRSGQSIRVPGPMLLPAFLPRMRSSDGALEYGKDRRGPYAAYRLQRGEALYSAVVGRFTGRTGAEDVRALATQLGDRSGIRDLRDIPVGFEIKIPLELVEPEYLPSGHPRRIEAETQKAELARELARRPIAGTRGGLEGVLIVLDPGHGGRDLGTMNNGLWEHDYVYDVTCRLKEKLERQTAAEVKLTLLDMDTGCKPSTRDKLVANHGGTILTAPPFLAKEEGEASIGVNLRWYLANSIYRAARREGTAADRVLFLSLHADARHPALRGVMVYVPGAGYRTKTYGHGSSVYKKYKEVREKTHVSFSRKERVRSEAVSRKLADEVVEAFRREKLPVHKFQPIRDRIIRGKSKWIPAVLRGNVIPGKVLVELVNLSNPDDAALLALARERDRLARGMLNAIYAHFGEQPSDVASRSRVTAP